MVELWGMDRDELLVVVVVVGVLGLSLLRVVAIGLRWLSLQVVFS